MANKIKKSELLKALKADLKEAERMQKDWFIKRETWLSETYGQPYGNEQDGKSKIVSKDIKKQLEWMLPSITDPFLSGKDVIKCSPITAEDAQSARQHELLLNTQFCRKFDRYNFIMKACRVLASEGTVVVQTGWEYEDEEVEVLGQEIAVDEYGNPYLEEVETVETRIIKNQPTAVVCRNEDIFVDPTCQDNMDDCQFVIHRYQTSLAALQADGRYKNLDKVAAKDLSLMSESQYYREDLTYFEFQDKPRKKMIINEYWGWYDIDNDGELEPIICAWIDDVIVRLETNPYPDKKPPFIIVPFISMPFQLYGEALAETIGDNQKVKTAITRGLIDNMAQSNNGQVGIRRTALDMQNRKKFLSGKNFEFNGNPSTDFWQGSYNQLPQSILNFLQIQSNEIESQTGVKSFSGGITGSALGNMLDILTDIPMADGSFKKLAHIVDGDKIVGSDGKATTVLKAHDIKYPKIAYDMNFDNGSVVKSGGEHLWTVKVQGTGHALREWTTMSADEVYKHIQKGRRVTIPAMKEMRAGTPTGNSIDPYVLGYWLGDGMSHSSRITTEDAEVLAHFAKAGYECIEVKDSSKCGNARMYDVYKIGHKPERDADTGQFTSTGSLHSELRELGLHARYGGEKHIPEEYFSATYEEKMELIRGLMDSDGYAHSGAFVQFCQSEGRLKDDMIKLLESLGLKVSIVKRDKDKRNNQKLALCEKTGAPMIWQRKDSYEIGFTPWSNPFKLGRKASKWKRPRKQSVALKSMEIVDKVLMRCLTVDSEDKLFAVTDKFTLTHNTATGARGALDATATRRLNIVRNISENLIKPLMRKWMCYNAEFLEDEEVIRVTNEQFVPVRRDDLEGKVDIDISISTAEDNASRAQELSFLLQTLGNTVPFEITQYLMANFLELMRMPDQAKQLREFKKEPSQQELMVQQIQLQKLMLENKKLEAEIMDKQARAGENTIDMELKKAKTQLEQAKVRSLHSKSDIDDLNFIKANENIDHQNAMEMADFNRRKTLDEMAFQAMHGGKNEQIGVPK